MIWRIVKGKLGSLVEVSTVWDWEDVLIAHEILDIQDEANCKAMKDRRR